MADNERLNLTPPPTSLRPRSREQGMNLGLRPQTREQVEESERLRETSEAFGDTEFRYDLDPQLSWNPLARLGYDPEAATSLKSSRPTSRVGAQFPKRASQEGIDRTMGKIPSYANSMLGDKVKPGDVVLTSNIANPPVWSHEFTHRGLQEVGALYRKDPDLFKEKYGEDAAALISSVDLTKGEDARDKDEYVVELLDDMSTEMSGLYKSMSETRDKVLSSDDKRAAERVASALKKDRAKNQSVEDIEGYTGRTNGIYGILAAAEDVLEEKGEPPLAKQQEPGFFKSIFKKLGFAEGGLAMEEQMSAILKEEGGLTDDGMERDPVSGNEVPPGSLAEEVRDDVDARLSGGEYVVPADVVRYYGVKFFEDLRGEAKEGLNTMEETGRIGGEPVPVDAPVQAASGGYIPGYFPGGDVVNLTKSLLGNTGNIASNLTSGMTATGQQQSNVSSPSDVDVDGTTYPFVNEDGTISYKKVGGAMASKMFVRPSQLESLINRYSEVGSETQRRREGKAATAANGQAFEYVSYTGPNGEILMVPFINGEPAFPIPEGYTRSTGTGDQPKVKTAAELAEEERQKRIDEGDFGGILGTDQENEIGMDLGKMSTDDIEAAISGIENNDTLSGKITNALSNSMIGKAIAALTGKTIAQKAIDDYKAELSKRSEEEDDETTPSKSSSSPSSTPSTPSVGFDGRETTTTAPTGFGIGKEGKGISTAPSTVGLSMGKDNVDDGREATTTAPTGFGFDGGPGPSGPSGGGTSGPSGGATGGGGADSGTGPSGGNASPGASGVGAPGVAGGEVGAGPGGTDAVGPMNKGGLIKRPSKRKRK